MRKKKEFWLFHPAIGHYRPTAPDPLTGEARIELLQHACKWCMNSCLKCKDNHVCQECQDKLRLEGAWTSDFVPIKRSK